MPGPGDSGQSPTKADVVNVLRELANGTMTREEASNWASKWIVMKDPGIEDPKTWRAIDQISGADMITTDRPYLYGKEDFEAWLLELQSDPSDHD